MRRYCINNLYQDKRGQIKRQKRKGTEIDLDSLHGRLLLVLADGEVHDERLPLLYYLALWLEHFEHESCPLRYDASVLLLLPRACSRAACGVREPPEEQRRGRVRPFAAVGEEVRPRGAQAADLAVRVFCRTRNRGRLVSVSLR